MWNRINKNYPWVFADKEGKQLTYSTKRYMMERLCKKAGIKPFSFHAIRHHVASILSDSGKASLGQIQKLLRHRRSTTTDNYLKTLNTNLKQVPSILNEQFNMAAKN
ncbi:MAG: site-specific integrase [Desulfobulbaceae bacterium]|nr:site-specific integrase [Desulfobulbaceae bacterium]